MAIGLPRDTGYGSLRFSLSKNNTKEEIDYLLETLPAIVEKLRKISPQTKQRRQAVELGSA